MLWVAEIGPGGGQDGDFAIGGFAVANISGLGPVSNDATKIWQRGDETAGAEGSEDAFELVHERSRGTWELVRGIIAHQRIMKGDTAVALGVVAERAAPVLGGPRAAIHWLGRPRVALGEKRPLDLLDTKEGVDRVLRLLGQIAHGGHF